MPATLKNIVIQNGAWVDVYQSAGIDQREVLDIQNVGTSDLFLSASISQPSLYNDAYRILRRGERIITDSGDPPLWVFSYEPQGVINVEIYQEPEQQEQITAYGELSSESLTPVAQIGAQYGLLDNVLVVTDKNSSGTSTANNGLFQCSSGTAPDGLASILSLRQLQYRPGQGAMARLSAVFTQGQIGSQQAAGLINAEDVLAFGYIDDQFGIIYAKGGAVELQELKITTPATLSETATITIDGVAYNVNITAGTVQHNAYEIATNLNGIVPNYQIFSNNDTVIAQSLVSLPQGVFAFSSATASASWTQIMAGSLPNVSLIPQSAWNRNGATWLDPTMGNVYWIKMQYLGFGPIQFFVKDPKKKVAVLVHEIENSNQEVTPSVTNPTFRIGWLARNTGGTNIISVSGAAASGFVEGIINRSAFPRAVSNTQSGVGSTRTNVISIRNRTTFGVRVNRAEVFPLLISVSTETSKTVFFEATINSVFVGDVIFDYIDKNGSIVELATSPVEVQNGRSIGLVAVQGSTPKEIRFNESNKFDTVLLPGQTLTISAFVTGGAASDMSASITWHEDF